MSNKKINQFPTNSIVDNSLAVVGDPIVGTLTQTSYKSVKDYVTNGLSFNTSSLLTIGSFNVYTSSTSNQISNVYASESNYVLTSSFNNTIGGLNTYTSSFNSFSGSYVNDSSSFNTRINSIPVVNTGSLLLTSSFNAYTSSAQSQSSNIFASQSNYTLTSSLPSLVSLNTFSSSILSYTGSAASQSINIFASQSNYTTTSSFNTVIAGINIYTASFNTFSSSYVSDSASFKSSQNNYVQLSLFNPYTGSTNTQILNVFASESNYVLTSSFNSTISGINVYTGSFTNFSSSYVNDSSSFKSTITTHTTQIANVFASESNYLLTSSFNTYTGSVPSISSLNAFTGSYVTDSSSFNTRILSTSASLSPVSISLAPLAAKISATSNALPFGITTNGIFITDAVAQGGINFVSQSPTRGRFTTVPGWVFDEISTLSNNQNCWVWQYVNANNATAGTVNMHLLQSAGTGFTPTGGTAVYNTFNIFDIINQSSGATGITRGIYINSTVTSASDYRALEISNGKSIVQNIGIGVSPTSSFLSITGSTTLTAMMNLASGSRPTNPKWGDIWLDPTSSLKIFLGTDKTFTLS